MFEDKWIYLRYEVVSVETKECIYKRRSIRKFKKDKIPHEIITELLKCAMAGPSACNKRPWEFYVIKNEIVLETLKKASKFTSYDAPLAIVVCGNQNLSLSKQENDFWIQDCSAAIENILLAATSFDLGSVWCGLYPLKVSVKRVKEILNIPEHVVPLGIVYIGYPIESLPERSQYEEEKIHIIE